MFSLKTSVITLVALAFGAAQVAAEIPVGGVCRLKLLAFVACLKILIPFAFASVRRDYCWPGEGG